MECSGGGGGGVCASSSPFSDNNNHNDEYEYKQVGGGVYNILSDLPFDIILLIIICCVIIIGIITIMGWHNYYFKRTKKKKKNSILTITQRQRQNNKNNDCDDCNSTLFCIFQFLSAKELAISHQVSLEWHYASKQTANTRLLVADDYHQTKFVVDALVAFNNNNNNACTTSSASTIIINEKETSVYLLLYKLEIHEHLPQWAAAAAAATAISVQPSLLVLPSTPMSTMTSLSSSKTINHLRRCQELPVQFQRRPYYLKCPVIGRIIMKLLIHSTSNNALYKLNYDNKQFMPIEIIPSSESGSGSESSLEGSSSSESGSLSRRRHPFGILQVVQIRPHYLRLYFVKDSMVIATWNFGFLPPEIETEERKINGTGNGNEVNTKDDDDGTTTTTTNFRKNDHHSNNPIIMNMNMKRTWFLDYQICPSYVKSKYKLCTDWQTQLKKNNTHNHNPTGINILEEATMFWSTIQNYFLPKEQHQQRIPIKRFCSYPNCNNHSNNHDKAIVGIGIGIDIDIGIGIGIDNMNQQQPQQQCQQSYQCQLQNNYKKCSRCQLSYYCSKNHQAKHWPIHKLFCCPDTSTSSSSNSNRITCISSSSLEEKFQLYEQLDHVRDAFVDDFSS